MSHQDSGGKGTAIVRAYRSEDRDAVVDVILRAIRESAIRDYSAAQIEAWSGGDRLAPWDDVRGRLILVAAVYEKVVGIGDLEPSGHLDRMYVHPEHQGQGVASVLLTRLELEARRQGVARLFTEASITARPFFERRGFEVIAAQIVNFRGQQFTIFRMAKRLAVARTPF